MLRYASVDGMDTDGSGGVLITRGGRGTVYGARFDTFASNAAARRSSRTIINSCRRQRGGAVGRSIALRRLRRYRKRFGTVSLDSLEFVPRYLPLGGRKLAACSHGCRP